MEKSYKRIFQSFIALLGCILLLAACGPKETVQPSPSPQEGAGLSFFSAGGGEGLNLAVEKNAFYDVAAELKGSYDDSTSDDGMFLGMQFYQGEPVQLWASAPYRDKGDLYVTVYMYRQDGTRETCVEQVDRVSGQRIGFRDSQGYCYSVDRGGENNDSIVKLDSSGKALYRAKLEGDRGRVKAFCEMADGRLAVLVTRGSGTLDYGVVMLNSKGELTNIELSGLTPGQNCYIGTSEEGLLLVTEERLFRVVLPEGKPEPLFSFVQTAYAVGASLQKPVVAFCLREDGKLEMLRVDQQGSGTCEALRLEEKSEDRQDVILRGWSVKNNSFLKEQVLKFNSVNDKYQVVIEGPEESDERDAYITRTSVELAAGKGPDILDCYLIESPESLIEKGVLADLAPLMEQAGMKEEDYFPVAFDKWRTEGSIYSIRCSGSLMERTISSAVLGDMRNPDIEILADALLAYQENAVYDRGFSAGRILRELLEGSETLWGMVDWEKGTCDFDGELFRKLLEAAKRYQYDAKNNYPVICSYRDFYNLYDLYASPSREEAEAQGNVPVGQLFDDGAHPVGLGSGVLFSINANAAGKEGAWEFLQFLLSEETQESMLDEFDQMPVKKSAFWVTAEEEIVNGPTEKYGKGSFKNPLSHEKAEEVAALLERVRALPYKTETILEIVLEEAQEYFDGVKEIPQVVDAVENRVGLYLMERR